MSDLVRSHIVIRRAEGAIFALIANIAGYHQWLPGSTMSVLGTEHSAPGEMQALARFIQNASRVS